MDLSREILRNRHRLSERQIDDFLGESTNAENQQDRLLGMQRIGAFIEVTKALCEQNIWFLNLKGPLLSQRIYGDPTYRAFRDFDLLVAPKDVNRTMQLLERHGYQSTEFAWPQSPKKQKITLHFINQVEMIHPKSGVMIEVHWKLFSTRIANPKTIRRLFEGSIESVEFGGQTLNRLSLEFELFYLIVHGGNHAWFRLKWLVDIHEILKREEIHWDTFDRIISDCNAHRQVDICNDMLQEFFPNGKQFPSKKNDTHNLGSFAIEQCKQPEGDPHISRLNTTRLTLYRWKLFPHWQHKVDVTKVITFCKTDLKYDWLPPSRFVYYLFRPVGYVLRAIGVLK
ncbi:nucleotidyltransferase domain-containing protein [Rhodohalobacter sp. 614A]|uniref:nucleotidyltransferase domain-containing protein n=1 Tax=Rhodohalobacter sp. 614A TaxID=2908649 RepID=UPI001F316761|nr:nucleotidyltransferase family protein [Rhodohalobacter sp. 614A]